MFIFRIQLLSLDCVIWVKPQPALTDSEKATLLDALELAYEHATVRKRSAIRKVYDKLAA
jgi:hypothetical protein